MQIEDAARTRSKWRASSVTLQWRFLASIAGLVSLLFSASSPAVARSTGRIEVPILQHRLSNGEIRFFVRVQVSGVGEGATGASGGMISGRSGAPIAAMLDTGSFGLRVMARALSPMQYETIGIRRGYRYSSGVVLRGPLGRAVVSIGDATTGVPIGIQVVRSVVCSDLKPHCPASRLDPADYRIGGDGLRREGFDAILGLSLRGSNAPGAAVNPLSVMGSRRWIVVLPRPDATAPGLLIINPDAHDLAGFHPVELQSLPTRPDGQPQVQDTKIPSCPDSPLDIQASCPPMLLDSGAGPGVRPFYAYAVLFDTENKTIAVKPRS